MAQTHEQQVVEKLDQILRVLVLATTRGLKQREQITILDNAGFQPKVIAELLGTSSNTVRVELVSIRKGDKASKRKSS